MMGPRAAPGQSFKIAHNLPFFSIRFRHEKIEHIRVETIALQFPVPVNPFHRPRAAVCALHGHLRAARFETHNVSGFEWGHGGLSAVAKGRANMSWKM